jgi:hypothetical protein
MDKSMLGKCMLCGKEKLDPDFPHEHLPVGWGELELVSST